MIALTALALASRPLSAYVLAWSVSRGLNVRPGTVFVATMAPLGVGALLTHATVAVFPETLSLALVQALAGLFLGGVMIFAEQMTARRPVMSRDRPQSPTAVDERLLTDPCTRDAPGIARTYGRWAAPQRAAVLRPWSLPELVGVAVLEEVLYRGVVVSAALALDDLASSIGLVLTSAVLFGLSHDAFGTRHVVLKSVHAGALSISVLAAGTLLPAVVAHLTLNACSWAEARRWTRAAALSGRGA